MSPDRIDSTRLISKHLIITIFHPFPIDSSCQLIFLIPVAFEQNPQLSSLFSLNRTLIPIQIQIHTIHLNYHHHPPRQHQSPPNLQSFVTPPISLPTTVEHPAIWSLSCNDAIFSVRSPSPPSPSSTRNGGVIVQIGVWLW